MAETVDNATVKVESKPVAEQPKRWADEADEETPKEPSASSTSEDKGAEELGVENLAIDEEKKKINKFLDEPEDSNIKAVCLFVCLFLFFFFFLCLRSEVFSVL